MEYYLFPPAQVMVEGTIRQGWYRPNALMRAPKDAPPPPPVPEESRESRVRLCCVVCVLCCVVLRMVPRFVVLRVWCCADFHTLTRAFPPTLAHLPPQLMPRAPRQSMGHDLQGDGSTRSTPTEPVGPGWLTCMAAAMADKGKWGPIFLLAWGGDPVPRPPEIESDEWNALGAEQQQRAVVKFVRQARAVGAAGRRFPVHCHCLAEEPKPDGALGSRSRKTRFISSLSAPLPILSL